jgi:hypothetical protein
MVKALSITTTLDAEYYAECHNAECRGVNVGASLVCKYKIRVEMLKAG